MMQQEMCAAISWSEYDPYDADMVHNVNLTVASKFLFNNNAMHRFSVQT